MPCLAKQDVSLSLVHQGVSCYLSQLIEPTVGKGFWAPMTERTLSLEEPRRNAGLAGPPPPEPPPSTLDRTKMT